MTPRDQLRLRLTDHDFKRLMQAAKPLSVSDRDAFLRDVAAELGQHEVACAGCFIIKGLVVSRAAAAAAARMILVRKPSFRMITPTESARSFCAQVSNPTFVPKT